MRVVHGLLEVHPASRSFVTIGIFDGVHRGHQRLITDMLQAAHSTGNVGIVLTFDPHPAAVLRREAPPLLTTLKERAQLLAALELDVLVVLPFTPATVRTPAADFIERMTHHLHLAQLWVGPNFALGHRREGDIPTLRSLGTEHAFTVEVVEPSAWDGQPVSSSRVRDALKSGDIFEVTGCLGRPYRLAGVVVRGRGVGRSIGVPTANLSTPPNRLIPASGVYACLAHTERLGTHPAAANIGTRPTFAQEELVVEAHLLDFGADLYDEVLTLDFIARLREERVYSTLNALVAQLHDDVAQIRILLSSK